MFALRIKVHSDCVCIVSNTHILFIARKCSEIEPSCLCTSQRVFGASLHTLLTSTRLHLQKSKGRLCALVFIIFWPEHENLSNVIDTFETQVVPIESETCDNVSLVTPITINNKLGVEPMLGVVCGCWKVKDSVRHDPHEVDHVFLDEKSILFREPPKRRAK
jgi:hypothetical protein